MPSMLKVGERVVNSILLSLWLLRVRGEGKETHITSKSLAPQAPLLWGGNAAGEVRPRGPLSSPCTLGKLI